MRIFPIILTALLAAPAVAQTPSPALEQAVASPVRTEANKARDQYQVWSGAGRAGKPRRR